MIEQEEVIFEFNEPNINGSCMVSCGPEVGRVSFVAKKNSLGATSIVGKLHCYDKYPGGNGFRPFDIAISYYDAKSGDSCYIDIIGVRLHGNGRFMAIGISSSRNRSVHILENNIQKTGRSNDKK